MAQAAPSPVDGVVCTPVMRIDRLVVDSGVVERAAVVSEWSDQPS